LQVPTEFIVLSKLDEVFIEAQGLHDARIDTECDRRITLFDTAQSLPVDASALGDGFGCVCATQSRLAQPFSETGQLTLQTRQ
jgi:hypothetical protein